MDSSYFQVNPETTTRRDDNAGEIMDPPKHFDISKMGESPFKRQKQLRRYRLLLNSSFRPTSCTSPSNYTVHFPEPIYGIESIQLQRAFIPMSIYTINDNNNVFAVNINTVDYNINLTNGNYTNAALAAEIKNELNAATGTGTGWIVTHDSASGLMTINSTSVTTPAVTSFSVRAGDMPNLSPVVGFGSTTVTGLTIVSPQPMNTSMPLNILLNLGQGNDRYDSLLLPTATKNIRCFAYIPIGIGTGSSISESAGLLGMAPILVGSPGLSGGYKYYAISKDTTTAYYDFYEGSKSVINKMSVSFEQLLPDGNVVTPDFNNADHVIELELVAQVDKISSIV